MNALAVFADFPAPGVRLPNGRTQKSSASLVARMQACDQHSSNPPRLQLEVRGPCTSGLCWHDRCRAGCYGGYAFPDMVRMSSCPTGGAGRGRSLSRTCCFLSRPVVRFQVSFLEGPDDFVGPSYPFNKLFFFPPANSSCQGGGLRGGPEATLLYVTGGV